MRRKSSLSPSLTKHSLLCSRCLGVHVHVCRVRCDFTRAMLSRLVCRNGLREHNCSEITYNKVCHSYEAQHLSGSHRIC